MAQTGSGGSFHEFCTSVCLSLYEAQQQRPIPQSGDPADATRCSICQKTGEVRKLEGALITEPGRPRPAPAILGLQGPGPAQEGWGRKAAICREPIKDRASSGCVQPAFLASQDLAIKSAARCAGWGVPGLTVCCEGLGRGGEGCPRIGAGGGGQAPAQHARVYVAGPARGQQRQRGAPALQRLLLLQIPGQQGTENQLLRPVRGLHLHQDREPWPRAALPRGPAEALLQHKLLGGVQEGGAEGVALEGVEGGAARGSRVTNKGACRGEGWEE